MRPTARKMGGERNCGAFVAERSPASQHPHATGFMSSFSRFRGFGPAQGEPGKSFAVVRGHLRAHLHLDGLARGSTPVRVGGIPMGGGVGRVRGVGPGLGLGTPSPSLKPRRAVRPTIHPRSGKVYSPRFASRILHRSPSRDARTAYESYPAPVGEAYMLWCRIMIRENWCA